MHRLVFPLLLIAAAVPARAAAQPAVPVPPGYTAAHGLGDSATAVFTGERSAVAVAALPGGTDRAAVIQHLRAVLAGAASGRDPGTFRWRMVTSSPASPFDVYHERWMGFGGTQAVLAEFHHLRKDGRNVLLAAAFRTARPENGDMLPMAVAPVSHFPTGQASGFLVGELVGDPPFTGGGIQAGIPAGGVQLEPSDFEGIPADFEGRGTAEERPPHPDEAAVRTAFEGYRAAALARDGQAALPHVADAVFEYYGDVQHLTLYGTADEVRARPLADQMLVLLLRARVPAERLREMTARDLIAHALTQGWIGEESAREQRLGRVHVDGNMAWTTVMQGARESPIRFYFVRQDGAWKWDMLGTIQLMDPVFRQLAETSRLTPEELLLRVVEIANGRPLPPTVWDPPLRRP